jgi:hypothetical protein
MRGSRRISSGRTLSIDGFICVDPETQGATHQDVGCMTVGEDSMNLLSHGQVVAVKISMSFPFFVQTDFV